VRVDSLHTKLTETSNALFCRPDESVDGCEGPSTRGKQHRSYAKVFNSILVRKGGRGQDRLQVGLEAAILVRSRNSAKAYSSLRFLGDAKASPPRQWSETSDRRPQRRIA